MMGNCWKRVTHPKIGKVSCLHMPLKNKISCFQCCGSKSCMPWCGRKAVQDDQGALDHHNVKHDAGNVHLVSTVEDWEAKLSKANEGGKIVVANFSTLWSNPSRAIAATYGELSLKYNSVLFLTVDVDKLTELSTSWGIKASPTFIFLKDGRQIDKYVGADKQELSKKLSALT